MSAHATFSSSVEPVQHWARYYGTNDSAHVDYTARTVTRTRGPGLPSAIGRLAEGVSQSLAYARASATNFKRFARSEFHYFAGFNKLFSEFYNCIRTGGPDPIPPRDIRRIAWMLDEIFAKSGMTKELAR